MPLFSVDVQKFGYGEYWTNRYIVTAAELDNAVLMAQEIVDAEVAVHLGSVIIERARVADLDPATDLYTILPIEQAGQRTAVGDALPLFNVIRVDFRAAVGRPSRKYLRGILQEGDTTGQALSTALRTSMQTLYADPLAAALWYVDVDGQELLTGTVFSAIHMRQLRRGSRRRTLPILPPA